MQIYFTVVLGDVDGAKFNNKKNMAFVSYSCPMGGTNWTKLNLRGSKCVTKLLSTELSKSEHALHTTSLLKQTSFTFFPQ
jgi:hypothetical protein